MAENGLPIFGAPMSRTPLEAQRAAGGMLPEKITQEWVEQNIVPHLRALSRLGIHIIFDSGVEPLTRG